MKRLAGACGVQLKNSSLCPLRDDQEPSLINRVRSVVPLFREAILEHLEEIEDLYLAEGALERIRSGEEQTIPLKQVIKRHGLQR